MSSIAVQSSAKDFDFFIGRWQVSHRKLQQRLSQCCEWDEFSGTCHTQKILNNMGNFDDNFLATAEGSYCAATIRTYNEATNSWSIWWLDGRNPDQLDVPMRGQFIDGLGTFYAQDTLDNQPIKVRFLWSMPSPDAPRWEQAFSLDEGATWETNWSMDFTRVSCADR